MKYQFITIKPHHMTYSFVEIINESILQEYIKPFSEEEIYALGGDWFGVSWKRENEVYIWKKLET